MELTFGAIIAFLSLLILIACAVVSFIMSIFMIVDAGDVVATSRYRPLHEFDVRRKSTLLQGGAKFLCISVGFICFIAWSTDNTRLFFLTGIQVLMLITLYLISCLIPSKYYRRKKNKRPRT